MKRKYEDDTNMEHILGRKESIRVWMEAQYSHEWTEIEESYSSINEDNISSSTNEDNISSSTDEDEISTWLNEQRILADAKKESLRKIDKDTDTVYNPTDIDSTKELLGELDKGTGELSDQLTDIQDSLVERDIWIENACEASDGNYSTFNEDECQKLAKTVEGEVDNQATDLVDSIKDVIMNTTDLNDVALTPEVVEACVFVRKIIEIFSS